MVFSRVVSSFWLVVHFALQCIFGARGVQNADMSKNTQNVKQIPFASQQICLLSPPPKKKIVLQL